MALTQAGTKPAVEYPSTDGEPMAQNTNMITSRGEGRGEGGFESCAFTNFGSAVGITTRRASN
jgi:hypothetical protein